jgi:AraC family transcriptional regulator of adaptative response/methylated-DNA-[protein]-cysteine methyltransferase
VEGGSTVHYDARLMPLPALRTMRSAVTRRDPKYDGLFFAAVASTNIFCLPSCPSRRPRPDNLRFYGSAREALAAGFRPCLRCRPLEAFASGQPAWVGQLLQAVESAPQARLRDRDLRRLRIDPVRARRYFQRTYGMTFQAYCRARRLGEALRRIRDGAPIDDAVFDHGYESHSGFRAAFNKLFGAPPKRSRTMQPIVTTWAESPLGPLLLGATEEGICLVEFTDRRALETQMKTLVARFGRPLVPGRNPHLERLRRELDEYFAGRRRQFSVPLEYPGSPFQRAVWQKLLAIPYGETRSYEDLAKAARKPGGSRAVGQANGANRIAIVIPCHRVVNKGGALGGYGGGRWRKEWLLALERRVANGEEQLGLPAVPAVSRRSA